jgi:hypothetical protein
MLKVIGAVVVGVVVGAVVYDAIKKKKPTSVQEVEEKVSGTFRGFVDAFKEGYRSTGAD